MDNLPRLKMTPQIEAYQDDYVGWQPQNEQEAQIYYKALEYMKSLPPHLQPTTDQEIYTFMKAYSDMVNQGSMNQGLKGLLR